MIAYRFTIYSDSVREAQRGAASRSTSTSFQRETKATVAAAVGAFRGALAEIVPDGRNARAWLEVSVPKEAPRTIERWQRGEEAGRDRQGRAISGSWVNSKGERVLSGDKVIDGSLAKGQGR